MKRKRERYLDTETVANLVKACPGRTVVQNPLAFLEAGACRMGERKREYAVDEQQDADDPQASRHADRKEEVLPVCFAGQARVIREGGMEYFGEVFRGGFLIVHTVII